MKSTRPFIATILCFLILQDKVIAQPSEVTLPGTELRKFTSSINGRDYALQISVPGSYNDSTRKQYPVVYVLDGQWSFPTLISLAGGMHYDGLIPELIVVGIAYTDNYEQNRARDFSPTRLSGDSNTGGASKFLEVLKREIVGRIDAEFRTDKAQGALFGGSYSGLFQLYVLFTEPGLFSHYMIGSPYLNYDNNIIWQYEKEYRKKHTALRASLFISSGEYEEIHFLKSQNAAFVREMESAHYSGLLIERMIVEKMSHASEWAPAAQRALAFFYDKPTVKLDLGVLKQYIGRYKSSMDTTIMSLQSNTLCLKINPEMNLMLSSETPVNFYAKGLSGRLHIDKDSKGKVIGYTVFVPGMGSMVYSKMD